MRWGTSFGIRRSEATSSSATWLKSGGGSLGTGRRNGNWSGFGSFVFVKATVANECTKGGGPGDIKAGKSVEKATPQNVGAEKTPTRAGQGKKERKAVLFFELLFEEKVGESIDFGDVA